MRGPASSLQEWMTRPADTVEFSSEEGPRSLYVHRPVLNADEIRQWAKANGFPVAIPEHEMHVTIVYSKEPVDWDRAGPPDTAMIVIPAESPRWIEQFDDNAVVLVLSSVELQARHYQLREAGAKSTYPDYNPHVTISYQTPEQLNISALQPFTGEIRLGPEVWEEITDNKWRDQLVEDRNAAGLTQEYAMRVRNPGREAVELHDRYNREVSIGPGEEMDFDTNMSEGQIRAKGLEVRVTDKPLPKEQSGPTDVHYPAGTEPNPYAPHTVPEGKPASTGDPAGRHADADDENDKDNKKK